jgi:hypothetical protein
MRCFLSGSCLLAFWLLVAGTMPAAAAPPRLCLPPVFEGGRRLHQGGAPRVFWLPLLLRQHQLCWHAAAGRDEARIFLLGSSGVFGFPLPVDESFGALLNEHFARDAIPAHLFNLCSVFPYQVRDALILHEALRYEPDLIVYPVTPSEFVHVAPALFPPQLVAFFARNRGALAELVDEETPGLDEPFDRYRPMLALGHAPSLFDRLREVGAFARVAAGEQAEALAHRLEPSLPLERLNKALTTRQTNYDCATTTRKVERDFNDWKSWNILEYLADLRARRGVAVLIAHWPIAHEPVGDCYNVRLTNTLEDEFADWLREQTSRLGLPYVDLHDLLAPEEFLDSLHVSPEGHRKIAARMAEVIDPMVRGIVEKRGRSVDAARVGD